MLETSEIARLLIALAVLPFLVIFGRRLRAPSMGVQYVVAAGAVYLSYVFTVVEEFYAFDVFNTLQHGFLALGGIAAVFAALYTRRAQQDGS